MFTQTAISKSLMINHLTTSQSIALLMPDCNLKRATGALEHLKKGKVSKCKETEMFILVFPTDIKMEPDINRKYTTDYQIFTQ